MSYKGKRHYLYIDDLERKSVACEDVRRGVSFDCTGIGSARKRTPHQARRVAPVKPNPLAVVNHHGGVSYTLGPLETLKMVSTSSFFGEPQYYRDGERAPRTAPEASGPDDLASLDALLERVSSWGVHDWYVSRKGPTSAEVMERAIDEALDADFGSVLAWALELRERYQMRLSPQVILVRAAAHPGRAAWAQAHPGEFQRISQRVMARADDVTHQVEYWISRHGSKRGVPAILKRSWASRVSAMDAYAMAKYGEAGIGLVDVVRICHAKGPLVDALMREGRVDMPEGQDTWERLRAGGMGWAEILSTIRMPHMALLRNLRGIFSEVEDPEVRARALEQLKRGVRGGRQFPFRYLSAWNAVGGVSAPWVGEVRDALEACMDIACENLPVLPGRSAFLADVSGSMWSTCTSQYGSMRLCEIANLASVAGAMRSEEGVVFPFAVRMERVRINREAGVLEQADLVGTVGRTCGGCTENPLELLLGESIPRREWWDNIFVYSDMQAGHMRVRALDIDGEVACLTTPGLVDLYRRRVNPRVNVYCIQVGGYDNSIMPEYGYRSTNLYGWCGKELVFAEALGRLWDEIDDRGSGQS